MRLDVRLHVHANIELQYGEDTDGQDHILDDDNIEVGERGLEGPFAEDTRCLSDELDDSTQDRDDEVEVDGNPFALLNVSLFGPGELEAHT